MNDATDEQPSAWDNPRWVLAVMHYPGEPLLLERISDPTFEWVLRLNDERAIQSEAAKRGIVAGHVLMTLYAMEVAPWKIAEPSLGKALHVVEQFAYMEKYADGSPMPRGKTEVRACFDAMRPVAHLWAALRLHREYPTMPHDDLIRTEKGIETLLRIARGVQNWALAWKPRRTKSAPAVLGSAPRLVPEKYVGLTPPWGAEPPQWLVSSLNQYRRKR